MFIRPTAREVDVLAGRGGGYLYTLQVRIEKRAGLIKGYWKNLRLVLLQECFINAGFKY